MDYSDWAPRDVRALISAGKLQGQTSGMCAGYAQANLCILPKAQAFDFLLFCMRNPRPCPILEVGEVGCRQMGAMARGDDVCTAFPKYRIWRAGELVEEVTDISAYWQDDLVYFLIGCSFSFESELLQAGVPVRHIEEGRNVPAKDRFLAILATLVGASAVDEYALMLPAALNFGLIPDEVVELIYQAVPYLGIGRVRPFFKVTNKIFDYRGETITDPSRSTITGESRLEKGVEKQVEIFGEAVRNSYQEGPEDTRHIKKWLANMFGDYYTRKGLSIAHREMITFCFLSAQGGCEPQLKAHVEGNLNVGNSKKYLINIASQCVPYIGYPRTLNALRCIQDGYTAWEAKQ